MPLLPPGSRCTGWLPIGTAKRRLPADSLVAVSQPPPPPAYGYPQQPQPQPQTSSDAIVALVLAILSWAVCPFVLAIVALIFASKASKAIVASNGWVNGSGMVTAAKIIAWINIAVGILVAGFLVVALIAGLASTSVDTNNVNALIGWW